MKALSLTLFFGSLAAMTAASDVSLYLFYPFQDEKEFPLGSLAHPVQGLQVITPDAVVTEGEAQVDSRHLDVSGSVVVMGNRFTGNGQTHLEIWVKPQAVDFADGAEFLDFDGAAVALFRSGDGQAELHALHIGEDQRGFWVSTGVRIAVTNHVAGAWFRLNIAQQWEAGTWDLAVNGTQVLQGIGRGGRADGKLLEVWPHGNGPEGRKSFEDLAGSADLPDVLESQLASLRQPRSTAVAPAASMEKKVKRLTSDAKRRQHTLPEPDPSQAGKVRLLNLSLKVVGGGRHIGEFESRDKSGNDQKFALYTPGYDENGKPKPLQIRIRCDAELEEGASLGRIEWAVTEHPQEGDSRVKVIVFGTFANGPSVLATIPSEWSNKPLSIQCGQLGLTQPYPSTFA